MYAANHYYDAFIHHSPQKRTVKKQAAAKLRFLAKSLLLDLAILYVCVRACVCRLYVWTYG